MPSIFLFHHSVAMGQDLTKAQRENSQHIKMPKGSTVCLKWHQSDRDGAQKELKEFFQISG